MVGELHPIDNTNLLFGETGKRETQGPVLWTLLYVRFNYWFQGHGLTLLSSPWTTVALRLLLLLQRATAGCFRKAKPTCYKSKI